MSVHLSELRVEALAYVVVDRTVSSVWIDGDGERHRQDLGPAVELAPRIEALREQLTDTRAVMHRELPLLREFADGWGRALVPEGVLADPPDVLVIVPHALLHDVPLQFVMTAGGRPLACETGVCLASSPSQYVRSAVRNPARRDRVGSRTMSVYAADVIGGLDDEFLADARRLGECFAGETYVSDIAPVRRVDVRPHHTRDVVCILAHGHLDAEDHRLSGLLVNRDESNISNRSIRVPGDRLVNFRDLPLREFPAIDADRVGDVATLAEWEIDGASDAELVVLLACSTGSGQVLEGDEPASIAEALLHVGAATVIAPLWAVDRELARRWAERFFTGWQQERLPKALAAREALRELHEDGGRVDQLPSLALRGDWV